MHKHIFTLYEIPEHWFGTGSWNPSSCKTKPYLFYIVNIMGADVLATQGAQASATVIFTMLERINAGPAREGLTHEKPVLVDMTCRIWFLRATN